MERETTVQSLQLRVDIDEGVAILQGVAHNHGVQTFLKVHSSLMPGPWRSVTGELSGD